METDISTALATLQIDPDNAHALNALKGLRPGNGAGIDPVVLARALADARRWHRERGDFELWVQLIDLELPWTTDKAKRADLLARKGSRSRRRVVARGSGAGLSARGAGERSRPRALDRGPGADGADSDQLAADRRALFAAGRGRDRHADGVQPVRLGRRDVPQVPPRRAGGRNLSAAQS